MRFYRGVVANALGEAIGIVGTMADVSEITRRTDSGARAVATISAAALAIIVLTSWFYILGSLLGILKPVAASAALLVLGLTIVMLCISLWVASPLDLLEMSERNDNRIWHGLFACILTAAAV
jgi:hypothetical protein